MKKRCVSESVKKTIAARQRWKCANSPGTDIVQGYICPLWRGDDGTFDEAGFEIDHIAEVSVSGDNSAKNLQALCTMCHRVKTRRFQQTIKSVHERQHAADAMRIAALEAAVASMTPGSAEENQPEHKRKESPTAESPPSKAKPKVEAVIKADGPKPKQKAKSKVDEVVDVPKVEAVTKGDGPKPKPKAKPKMEAVTKGDGPKPKPKAKPKVEAVIKGDGPKPRGRPKAKPKVDEVVDVPKVEAVIKGDGPKPRGRPKAKPKVEAVIKGDGPKPKPKAKPKVEAVVEVPKVEAVVEVPKVEAVTKGDGPKPKPKAKPKVEEVVEVPKVNVRIDLVQKEGHWSCQGIDVGKRRINKKTGESYVGRDRKIPCDTLSDAIAYCKKNEIPALYASSVGSFYPKCGWNGALASDVIINALENSSGAASLGWEVEKKSRGGGCVIVFRF